MMKRFFAAVLLLVCTVPFTSQAETFDTCGTFIGSVPATISTQGVYCLRNDVAMANSTGNAITVLKNNVTIDCNGYKIGGLAAGINTGAIGIMATDLQNVTVRNCNIRGFKIGVMLTGSLSAGHLVEDNNFDGNTLVGIHVQGDGNLIRNNRVMDTGGGPYTFAVGIDAFGNTDVVDNTVDGVIGATGSNVDVYGIDLGGGVGVRLADNRVRNLVPAGSGTVRGMMSWNGGQKIFFENNRVSLPAPVANSYAFYCVDLFTGSLRDNSAWGFDFLSWNCSNSIGNVRY